MKLSVEHRVLGAPVNDRGDGVLSVTGGGSERGSILLSEFLDSSSSAPEDHASILFFRYPATELYTIIHYQAKFTAFPEHSRWYDERAIYELAPSEFGKINYSFRNLLPALDKFGEYTTRNYGVSNELEVAVAKNSASDSDKYAQTLKNAIVQGVLNNKKVFVQLGNDDKVKGDAIRKSPKLNLLLEAVALLPESWRKQVSVAYGVENHARVFGRIAPEILVFAIFDDVSNWGEWAADAIVIDWTGSLPTGVFESVDAQKLAVVDYFCNGSEDFKTTQDFTSHFGSVWEKVNRYPALKLDGVKTLPTSEVASIEKWYKSGAQAYRYRDIALRLLWLSALGRSNVESKSILGKYPELKGDSDYISIIKECVKQTCDFKKLSDLFDANRDVKGVCSAIESRIIENRNLTDACADNSKTPLSIYMQDSIKEIVNRWPDDEKIARLDKPYFGLSLENSFILKSWVDYNRLYNKMANRRDINKLPFQISWPDVIPAELFKKIQNQLSKDDYKKLYDKVAPSKATLNDYAAIACNYGGKFYPFIKDDIENALPTIDDDRFEKDVMTLLTSPESKEIGETIKNKYLAHKTEGLNNLIATLKNDCSDFLLKEITNERIYKILNSDNQINDNQLVNYLNDLYSIKSKRLVGTCNLILTGLADRYIHKELLAETPLATKSFWRLLSEPQNTVSKWFEIVVNRISELNSDDRGKLCKKYIDYYTNNCGNEQNSNVSKKAKLFVKKSTRNLIRIFQKANNREAALALKSVLPKSFTTDFAKKIRNLGGKKLMIGGIILFAIIIGIVIAVVLLAHGGDNKKKRHDAPPYVNDTTHAADTLYYKMLLSDTMANSMEWESIPLHSTHPMLLFANKFLDSLYIHPVSAYVEMRVSNNYDSVFRLQIGSDSIWFISRLLPMLEYYDIVLDKAHEKSLDTCSMHLKCVDGKRPSDTIHVTVNYKNPLIRQVLSNDTLQGCNVVSCNEVIIDNEDFRQRNGTLRTLGRTDYYLWLVQQMYRIKKHTSK